jgi:hypothetical protein
VSRTFVQGTLEADAAVQLTGSLGQLGVSRDAIYAAEAVDSPNSHPFIVIRWGTITPGVGSMNVQEFTVWVHDKSQDYQLIDLVLKRIRVLLDGTGPAATIEGYVGEISWQGDSGDTRDDGYHTITRNSLYQLAGSTR